MTEEGRRLVDECKKYLLAVMSRVPECGSGGPGARNCDIERECGFALDLPRQNRWFTWSLLRKLELDGKVDVIQHVKRGVRRYRLAQRE